MLPHHVQQYMYVVHISVYCTNYIYVDLRVHCTDIPLYMYMSSAREKLCCMRAKSPKQLCRVCTFFFWYCTLDFS